MRAAPNRKALFEVADRQQGYFTARQAIGCGFSSANHHYYVKNGEWTREGRGIYRLDAYPLTERPDLMYWFLWSRNRADEPQGIYGYATALALYGLSDVMPARIHMIVPKTFRRFGEIPKILRIVRREVPREDVEQMMGFEVTSPLRTLIDVIEEGLLSRELIQQAVAQALSRGLVHSRRDFMQHPHVKSRPKLRKKMEAYVD